MPRMQGAAGALRRSGVLRAVVPTVLGLLAVGSLVGIIIAAREAGGSNAVPPTPGPMEAPRSAGFVLLMVERVEGDRLAVAGGPASEMTVPGGIRAWRMERATPAQIQPGMRMAVVGVPNEVRNATIRLIVVADATEADEAGRVAGPFQGHETLGEPTALPLVNGVVRETAGDRVAIETASGPATVWLAEGAPVAVVRRVDAASVRPGDRLAVLLDRDGSPDLGRGILLMAGD